MNLRRNGLTIFGMLACVAAVAAGASGAGVREKEAPKQRRPEFKANSPRSVATGKPGPAPLATGPDPDLALVFTADVAGWLDPCG
jgi:hypothetical protein